MENFAEKYIILHIVPGTIKCPVFLSFRAALFVPAVVGFTFCIDETENRSSFIGVTGLER